LGLSGAYDPVNGYLSQRTLLTNSPEPQNHRKAGELSRLLRTHAEADSDIGTSPPRPSEWALFPRRSEVISFRVPHGYCQQDQPQ
jgi:hypothetical protein